MMRRYRAELPSHAAVVKIGGSLAYSPHLRDWLAACRSACRPVIVVAGGGPFADAVRDAQARMDLSDSAAHRMALLAMAQFAEAMASLEPGFTVAQGFEGLAKSLDEGTTPIWVPLELLAGAPGIEESWDVSSDSLAAWLATEAGIGMLVLVKQAAPGDAGVTVQEMADRGVVDRAFPVFLDNANVKAVWLGVQDYRRLDDALRGEIAPLPRERPGTPPPEAEARV